MGHGLPTSENSPATGRSYDLIAEFYDEDMGQNVSTDSVDFYARQCSPVKNPILELGCGTGRITLPLVKNGLEVVGLDLSLPMLRVLQRKARTMLSQEEQGRLRFIVMNMRRYRFKCHFPRILCPYSAFTYLVEEEARRQALASIRAHLDRDGLFILDIFIPSPEVMGRPDDYLYHDYRRVLPDGTVLERTKRIVKEVGRRVNLVTRYYRFMNAEGMELRKIKTKSAIRYYYPDELAEFLRLNGFQIVEIQGDFSGQRYDLKSKTAVFIARRAPS
jgi:SAM-dependent methyltransferase